MGKIKFVQIEPTTRCNYKCVFCCGRYFDQVDMDFQIFKKVADSYQDVEKFQIQGEGEPLLHPQFLDMVKYAKDMGKTVQTISNGSLFTRDRIIGLLESKIDTIYISIEAPDDKMFREIRGGSYEKLISNIKLFLELREQYQLQKPVLGFAVTIMKSTKGMFEEIIDLYQSLHMDGGITYHFLNKLPFYIRYYGDKVDNQLLSRAETKLLIHENDRLLAQKQVIDLSDHTTGEDYDNVGNCAWLDHGIYVNVRGNAMRCAFDKEDNEFTYGNVMTEPVEAVEARKSQFVNGAIPQPATLNCEKCHVFRRK
ncbi:radical SAM protein [Paenibacillus tepidiphilus]|uniref:radical SAM protein n=1 Tax=Paenibacillus tepidiphilus TaxID=2608683 RepID=UPI00123C6E58|nr:radical SAM protein [Paenibacillus tepidiphilus]